MKRVFCILLTIILAASLFSGCQHTHQFGEWKEAEPATHAKAGTKERYCSCGEKETESIPILPEETVKLKEAKAIQELEDIYELSMAQPSIWFERDGMVRAYCKINGKTFLHYDETKNSLRSQQWFAFIQGEYLYFTQEETTGETIYDVDSTTMQESLDAARKMKAEAFSSFSYTFSLVEQCEKFTCSKTLGPLDYYVITLLIGEKEETIKITVRDGLITAFEHVDQIKVNYAYDKDFLMPEFEEFGIYLENDTEDTDATDPTQAPDKEPTADPTNPPKNDPTQPNNPSEPEKPTEPTQKPNNNDHLAPEGSVKPYQILTQGNLDVALTSGAKGDIADITNWEKTLVISSKGYLSLSPISPSALNGEDKISSESVLKIPIYGSDGRIQELAAITENGTFQNGRYVLNNRYGVRAVGIFEEGSLTESYGYILDLSFRSSQDGGYLTMLTDGEQSSEVTFFLRDLWHHGEERFAGLASAYRIVFFDTEALTVLATAKLDADNCTFTDDFATVGLTMEQNSICQLSANSAFSVSVLIYLDGDKLTNADVFDARHFDCFEMKLGFTAK